MRAAFAHETVLTMSPGDDPAAPGAAVTVALCGHWEHEPPCRTPHHSATAEAGDDLVVRTLFATHPADEDEVRTRIADALAAGELSGPDGLTRWRLRSSAASELTAGERNHAGRLIRGGEG